MILEIQMKILMNISRYRIFCIRSSAKIMKKEKKPEKEENRNKEKSMKVFLKKRAPIYLAIITMLIVFVIPEFTAGSLQDYIPKDLTGNEKKAFDIFMSYRGPNNSGLNAIDVLADKISDDYPDEKIYDKKDTLVEFTISESGDSVEEYKILLDFQTKRESTTYEWSVNINTGEISSMNTHAKKILEVVDYSK